LAILVGLAIGVWSVWATMRHDAFGTFGFDFGIYDQGLWLMSHFHAPFITIMGVNLFGDHTSFILLPLVPFYWVFSSARVLIVAQAGALALAGVPLFLIARDKLRNEWLALAVVAAFLANPVLQWEGWEQFHPDVFEVPLAMCALYFMTRRRWRPYIFAVALLLLVKEDVALMTFVLGIYVARKYDLRAGIWTSALSLFYFAAAVWVILPGLNGEGTLDAWRVPYGGIGGLLKRTLTHPWDVVALAVHGEKRWYLWQLFASFGLLSLLAPSVVLIAVGPFASNLLSTFWYQYHVQYHYTTLIVPVLAFAAVVGIARIQRFPWRAAAVGVLVWAAVLTGWMWGPSQLARHREYLGDSSAAHVDPILAALRRIPAGASVASHYAFVTHLDHRREIYELPNPWYAVNWGDGRTTGAELPESARVQYIVAPRDGLGAREVLLLAHLAEREFVKIVDEGPVVVFKRVAPAMPLDPQLQAKLRGLAG
jgi:uncharacterized membrane protein